MLSKPSAVWIKEPLVSFDDEFDEDHKDVLCEDIETEIDEPKYDSVSSFIVVIYSKSP